MSEIRTCSKSGICKIKGCSHHGEHEENSFCDEKCDTIPDAACLNINEKLGELVEKCPIGFSPRR